MNATTPAQTSATPIKGSWEDVFGQAAQLAQQFDDQAIELYHKVIDGLAKLPYAQRLAANQRLQNLLMSAGVDLFGYLNVCDHYDDAVSLARQMIELTVDENQEFWESQLIDALLMADRAEEAIALVRAQAELPDAEPGDWGQVITVHMRAGQPQAAIPILDGIQERIENQRQELSGGEAGVLAGKQAEELQREEAYLSGLRSMVALESEDWEAGIAYFETAIDQGSVYADNLQLVYGRLVNAGRYDDALRFIDRDRDHPIRAGFWRGLALLHRGQADLATRQWRAVTKMDVANQNAGGFLEYILSYFYLHDPEGTGLGMVLRIIREENHVPWALFYLAGLGWAIRADIPTARSDFQIALNQLKSMADGKLLPHRLWQYVTDLVEENKQGRLAEFFDIQAKTEE